MQAYFIFHFIFTMNLCKVALQYILARVMRVLLCPVLHSDPRSPINLSAKKKRHSYVRVSGRDCSSSTKVVTNICAVNSKFRADVINLFSAVYDSEPAFAARVHKVAKRYGHVEISWREESSGAVYRRIYHPTNHMKKSLGMDRPSMSTEAVASSSNSPVSRAFIRTKWGMEIDVTNDILPCIGPRGDFYAAVGGWIRPVDVLLPLRSWFWDWMCIEWTTGARSWVHKEHPLSVPGKLYPDVVPFTRILPDEPVDVGRVETDTVEEQKAKSACGTLGALRIGRVFGRFGNLLAS